MKSSLWLISVVVVAGSCGQGESGESTVVKTSDSTAIVNLAEGDSLIVKDDNDSTVYVKKGGRIIEVSRAPDTGQVHGVPNPTKLDSIKAEKTKGKR